MKPLAPWLEYRLEALEFHNGAKIGFGHAQMLYRDDSREILIRGIGFPPAAVDATLKQISNPDGSLPPIKTIFYEMRANGYPREAFFFHPISRGADVRLEHRARGENVLYFNQKDGRPIFSKDWTLRQVTQGRIPVDRAVWQFHGYKHEH